jgi:heterodisulfide reductase subunit A
LAAAVIPSETRNEISQLFKVSLGPDDFFKEAHVKLRPVEFSAEGVYLCGIAHYPKHITEAINQAHGAAGRALTLLSHDIVTVSGSVCEVDEKKCIGCGACISACTYGAIEFRETRQGKKAVVNPVICKGDGLCNAMCPTGAIALKHFTDEELLSQIDAAVPEEDIIQQMDAAVGDI